MLDEQIAQQFVRFATRGQGAFDGLDMRRQHAIGFHRHKSLGQRQEIEHLPQVIAYRAFDLAGMSDHAFEGLVLVQPLDGRLRAALMHARHVVNRIADQRQIVDDALGRYAEFGLHAGAVERFIAHGVDQRNVLGH